jgi:curved DNA-binding protein CbpA
LPPQAYDTLSNPVKKKLYDAYATNDTKPDGMSYAEWESRQVEIPRWLERILRIPGGGIWWVLTCGARLHRPETELCCSP